MKKAPSLPMNQWTIREWGSLASCVGTLLLLWLSFGPRSKQLTGGDS